MSEYKRFGSYEEAVSFRSHQKCVDCGRPEGYTTVNNWRDIICRDCYTKRVRDGKDTRP